MVTVRSEWCGVQLASVHGEPEGPGLTQSPSVTPAPHIAAVITPTQGVRPGFIQSVGGDKLSVAGF